MQLFYASVFEGKAPEVQTGWNFFKGSLEIKNPDGSTSLFGSIKNQISDDRITLYDGYLNNSHPHYLQKDLRPNETSDYFLLTIVSNCFVDVSKSFNKNCGYIKIGPKRKKDKTLVLTTLCFPKDKIFFITFKNPSDKKTRSISIEFLDLLDILVVKDVVKHIVKPTLTLRAVRFLKKVIYKRRSIFGHF